MRQLVHSLPGDNNLLLFHFWWRQIVLKSEKVSKCFFQDCTTFILQESQVSNGNINFRRNYRIANRYKFSSRSNTSISSCSKCLTFWKSFITWIWTRHGIDCFVPETFIYLFKGKSILQWKDFNLTIGARLCWVECLKNGIRQGLMFHVLISAQHNFWWFLN